MIAPALIPRRPGDRVKTDRRDARKLAELLRAELLRAELLTDVHPPTEDQEAVRDLCRAREATVSDRTRARHRLSKLLLRKGLAYDGRAWTERHRRWLLTLRFEHRAAQATFDDHLRALEGVEERLRTLERELALCAESENYREAVGVLRCFRGVDTAWSALSRACHHHPYEIDPTAEELRGWIKVADRLTEAVERRA